MNALKRDFLPETLEGILSSNGLDGCVAVEARGAEVETETLLAYAQQYEFVKGVVGWVDLLDPHVGQRLEHFAQYPQLKGLRYNVQVEEADFMLRPDFQNGIAELVAYNFTFDVLVYPKHLPAAVQMAKQFPYQKFVVDHLAKPSISAGMDAHWKKYMKALGECPNVYCKISGMVTETENYHWDKEDFYPFLDVVVDAFGPDRLMFGSDWPVCLLAARYEQVLDSVKGYFARFSPSETAAMEGGSAAKFYDI